MCAQSVEIIPGLLNRLNYMEREIDLVEKSARKWETKAAKLELKVKKLEDEIPKYKSTKKYTVLVLAIIWFVVVLAILIKGTGKEECTRMPKLQGACVGPGGVF
ncbi:hypothetical protein ACH5RR_026763 [Cinchona calisaya]|uniref:Uncharacterized protein n=1 Tax=Cinchona calisaya TaxID=153742 RepID=A0ABD2Z5E0_9GENT